MFVDKLKLIPEGFSFGLYQGQRYRISKQLFNNGRSIKLYAKDVSGNDMISLNYYQTKKSGLLKPCEMKSEKVIHFIQNVNVLKD